MNRRFALKSTIAAAALATLGACAGTGGKDAVLENGMTVKVNQLCDVGDKVRVDTETGEFKERVTK